MSSTHPLSPDSDHGEHWESGSLGDHSLGSTPDTAAGNRFKDTNM